MRSIKFVVLAFVVFSGLAFAQEQEGAESNFTGEAKAEFVNNYYWRGAYLYPEGVPAFQPSLTLGLNDPALSLNIWSSLPLKQRTELKDVRDELDLTLNYDLIDEDDMSLSLGFISYIYFVGEFWHSEELYADFWYDVWNGLGFFAQTYIDVDAYKGIYLSFGPSYTNDLTEKLNLDTRVIFSFTKYDGASFAVVETGMLAALTYQMNDVLSMIGGLRWNYNIDAENNQYAFNLAIAASW